MPSTALRPHLFLSLVVLGGLHCATSAPSPSNPAPPSPEKTAAPAASASTGPEDPYLWLEEVAGEKALNWVKELNAKSTKELEGDPRFGPLKSRLLSILDSKEKIPWVNKQGKVFFNFWRDEAHARGVWRRVKSLAEYQKQKPAWDTVLDLDALSAAEKENWVWKGASCLPPAQERCLLSLSRGGADAVVVREFDTVKKKFVEGGFFLPEAKSRVSWKDLNAVYVGTDFGPGSLTESGYPRLTKEWKRGTKLPEAKQISEAKATDMSIVTYRSRDHGRVRDFVSRQITFFESETWLLKKDGTLTKLEVPLSAELGVWDDQLLVTLRDDWKIGEKTWPKGSLLTTSFDAFLKGQRDFVSLFTPSPNRSFSQFMGLRSAIVTTELEDVRNRLFVWKRNSGAWVQQPLDTKGVSKVSVEAVDDDGASDEYWYVTTDFTLPTTLSHGHLGKVAQQLKQSPAFFNTAGLSVTQHFATSKDGTKVPYFQVSREKLELNGENPTLLYGYGGFEVSLEANYSGLMGAGWMEHGGVYVQANIRGGGEYGPAWHQAALKTKRQTAYDDFIAVAEDLIARKVTSPKRLGVKGGSNGGLLVGVMLTQRPELFGAVLCEVPLLDMKRYSKLLAGASWVGEYGDPQLPEEWAAIAKYSPYQNVRKNQKYPRTLFTTSTRDDRVHPGHARKMVAKMSEQGHDILYWENTEGGHGGAANNEQRAYMSALGYAFLARQLQLTK